MQTFPHATRNPSDMSPSLQRTHSSQSLHTGDNPQFRLTRYLSQPPVSLDSGWRLEKLARGVALLGAALAMTVALAQSSSRAHAATVSVDTKLDAVTVFPDRALISRVARFTLPAGDGRVRVTNLPAKLDDQSVRVLVGGKAAPTLIGFSLESVPVSDEVSPQARALDVELRKLEAQDRALEAELRQVGDQRGFLISLRSTWDPAAQRRAPAQKLDPKSWSTAEEFLGGELTRLLAEARRIDGERRAVIRALELCRKQQEQLSSKRGTSTKALLLDVRAKRAGKATMTIRYLVRDTSWRSLYDARLSGAEVQLLHYALVTQESGEDWDDVKLSVSTAEPSRRVALPELVGRNLTVGGNPGYAEGRASATMAVRPQAKEKKQETKNDKDSEQPPPPPAPEAEARSAEFVTTYDAATRVSVPSSPAGRKTAIGTMKLATVLEHVAVPSRAQGAYMTAVGRVSAAAPLPAGDVSLFFGNEYVGATSIAQVVPGGELRLPFGRDERIRVRRVMTDKKRDEKGIFSKRERYNLRYEIRVENNSGKAIELVVLDQQPISQHGDIEVELAEDTTPRAPADSSDAPGVLRWKQSLAADGKLQLQLGFTVSYPLGQTLYGLW